MCVQLRSLHEWRTPVTTEAREARESKEGIFLIIS